MPFREDVINYVSEQFQLGKKPSIRAIQRFMKLKSPSKIYNEFKKGIKEIYQLAGVPLNEAKIKKTRSATLQKKARSTSLQKIEETLEFIIDDVDVTKKDQTKIIKFLNSIECHCKGKMMFLTVCASCGQQACTRLLLSDEN